MEVKTNREYKDRLFKKVFSTKEDLLSLYNAINNTSYDNPDDIEINTIEDYIYMGMKNDVSFLLYDAMNLYEHQSTDNPNMPLRGFLYLAKLYEKLFANHKDIYSSKLIMLPTPQFLVFYNGDDSEPDEKYMYMSDAFSCNITGKPALECRARMLNINFGHNKELMQKCKRLRDYATVIQKVKEYLEADGLEMAVDKAIQYCIENKILDDILLAHRMEVRDMLLAEYNEKLHIDNEKEISFEAGEKEGLAKGELIKLIRQIVKKIKRDKPVNVIADELEEEIGIVKKIYDVAKKFDPEYNIDAIYDELNK